MRSVVAKSFRRIMPRVMIGVLFVLEVAWILFLVYAFVRFALPGRWAHPKVARRSDFLFRAW